MAITGCACLVRNDFVGLNCSPVVKIKIRRNLMEKREIKSVSIPFSLFAIAMLLAPPALRSCASQGAFRDVAVAKVIRLLLRALCRVLINSAPTFDMLCQQGDNMNMNLEFHDLCGRFCVVLLCLCLAQYHRLRAWRAESAPTCAYPCRRLKNARASSSRGDCRSSGLS